MILNVETQNTNAYTYVTTKYPYTYVHTPQKT